MTSLIIEGGTILTPQQERFSSIWVTGRFIEAIADLPPNSAVDCQRVDASGCYVTPGLFDLQVNGNPSCNLWADPEIKQLVNLQKGLALAGVTSFLPTLITDDLAHMSKNINFLRAQGAGLPRWTEQGDEKTLARMPGIHLEGPFLSPKKPGVHPVQFLQSLKMDLLKKIVTDSVKMVTLAAELDPTGESVAYLVKQGIQVSLGHSNASFKEANQAFDQGVRLMTHTFNALPAIHHRAPGAVTAAFLDPRVSCTVICDGLHVDPVIVKLILLAKGVTNTILVSDLASKGTSQGELVGSSLVLSEAVKNVVNWGLVNFAEAITMAAYNPAVVMGVERYIGQLCPGHLADIVLWDKQTLDIRKVILGGRIVS